MSSADCGAEAGVIRTQVYYSGTVQGVGFRWTAMRAAAGHAVAGYVRNLPDGRVEVVAEGSAAEVAAFLAELAERLGDYISGQAVTQGPATGEFDGFDIRH
jgi:acylphosphatase